MIVFRVKYSLDASDRWFLKFLSHIAKKLNVYLRRREPRQNRGVAETQRVNFHTDACALRKI